MILTSISSEKVTLHLILVYPKFLHLIFTLRKNVKTL